MGARRRRRGRGAIALSIALSLAAGGCSRCSRAPAPGDAAAPAGGSLAVGFPKTAEPPTLGELEGSAGYGLPAGCRLIGKIRRAPRGDGHLRFVAARHELGSLALARSSKETKTTVSSAGFYELGSGAIGKAPWGSLAAPPAMDKSARGWLAAWSLPGEPGRTRALLWRGAELAELLLEGYELSVADLACSGDECAVLTSLARASLAPGATLALGSATSPASSWTRVDVEPGGDEPWGPLAIAGYQPGRGHSVALSSGKHVALYRVQGSAAEKLAVLDAPHGAYDATLAPAPLVVAPGKAVDSVCGSDEFPVVLSTQAGRSELRTPAPPESVVARSLTAGALVAWVAPVSCALLERRVVYVTLVGSDGRAVSSPMAIGNASGFALSTAGNRFGLWLLGTEHLSYLEASCDPAPKPDAGDDSG